MKKLALTTAAILAITGCSAITPKSTTPIPTEELTAIGSHSSKAGSHEVAFEQAKKFCGRWRTAPSIIRKQLKYNGTLTEDTNTAVNVAVDVARVAGNWIPGVGNNDAYETTITYKCY